MWAGNNWNNVHADVYNYADCKVHKHATLEDMCIGIWEKTERDTFEKWVRRKVLEPFLFMECYSFPNFTLWAKGADLLPKESFISDGRADMKTKDTVILLDTVSYHLPWMLQFLQVLSLSCQLTRVLVVQNKRKAGELSSCNLLDDASKCIAQNELYKIFRKYVPLDVYPEKMLTAAFCITFVTWHQLLEQDWCHTKLELGSELSEEQKRYKALGNEEYNDNQFNQAVASYTKIIKKTPDNAVIYGNRAQAYLKLGKFNEAEIDCRRVVVLDPFNSKAYARLVTSREGVKDYHSAHLLATYGYSVCSAASQNWNELYELSVKFKQKCEVEGVCSEGGKFQHEVLVPKMKETIGIPDLVSSGEESSNEDNLLNGSCTVIRSGQDSKRSPPHKLFQYTLGELLLQLKALKQEGSNMLLSAQPQEAAKKYLQALDILPKLSEQNYDIEIEDQVCLKYALGVAYQQGSTEILKGVEVFQEILNNFGNLNFTPAYSGMGQIYMKLFEFEQALEHFTSALVAIDKSHLYRTYDWPGTTRVIEDSIPEKHKEKIKGLIYQCQFPPNPDAICRLDFCLLPSKNIYLGNPEFKGYYRLSCETGCKLEYHPQCWKRVKESLDRNKKGITGQVCLTPDCGYLVVSLEKFGHEGNLLSRAGAEEKEVKQRKSKLQKKMDQKEQRKQQKRKERTRLVSTGDNEEMENAVDVDLEHNVEQEPQKQSHVIPQVDNGIPEVIAEEPITEETGNKFSVPLVYNVNDEPAYVIRRGDATEEVLPGEKALLYTATNPATGRKKRQKTKKQPATLSVYEFCADVLDSQSQNPYFNQYLRRLYELQREKDMVESDQDESWPPLASNFRHPLDTDSPFFIPEHLRDNPEELERVLRLNTWPPGKRESNEKQKIKDNIFEFMEQFFQANGPMHKDSPLLQAEVSCFPGPAQELICEAGGLVSFLKESLRFIIKGDTIYATSEVVETTVIQKVEETQLELEAAGDGVTISFNSCIDTQKAHVSVNGKHHEELLDLEVSSSNLSLNSHPFQSEVPPLVNRTNSIDSSKSASSNSLSANTTEIHVQTSVQALKSIEKLCKTLPHDLQVAIFKLQVSISALSTEEQEHVVCCVINSVKSNLSSDFWNKVNPNLDSVRVLSKDGNMCSEMKEMVSSSEFERLCQEKGSLEDRLSSALDNIAQLQNAQTLHKAKYEDQIDELKTSNQKLQASLNSFQTRAESEKQHTQQERAKLKEEATQLKKEKQEEVATARQLLTSVMEENNKLQKKLDKEKEDNVRLKNTLTLLMENCEESARKAEIAKENLIILKKDQGLKLIDKEIENLLKSKAQLLDSKKREQEKPTLSASVFEVLLEKPLRECEAYLTTIRALKKSFLSLVEKHMIAVRDGDDPPVSLEIPVLPDKPNSLSTIGQASLAALPPSYTLNIALQPAAASLSAQSTPIKLGGGSLGLSTPQNIFQTSTTSQPLISQTPPLIAQAPPSRTDVPMKQGVGISFGAPSAVPTMIPQHRLLSGSQIALNNVFQNNPLNPVTRLPMTYIPQIGNQVPVGSLSGLAAPVNRVSTSSMPKPMTQSSSNSNNPLAQSLMRGVEGVQPMSSSTVNLTHIPTTKPSDLKPTVTTKPSFPTSLLPNTTMGSALVTGAHPSIISVPPGMTPLTSSSPTTNQSSVLYSAVKPPELGAKYPMQVLKPSAAPAAKPKNEFPRPALTSINGAQSVAQPPKNNFDKLIKKLQELHPLMTNVELENFVRQFRSQRQGLSGMPIDKIIEGVSELIQKISKQEPQKPRVITPVFEHGGRQGARRAMSGLEAIDNTTGTLKMNSKDPWGASSLASHSWTGSDDNTCSICLETMSIRTSTIHTTECKHRFHFKCIQEWLKRNSKCPNCNSHTLLPTEYPPLGQN